MGTDARESNRAPVIHAFFVAGQFRNALFTVSLGIIVCESGSSVNVRVMLRGRAEPIQGAFESEQL